MRLWLSLLLLPLAGCLAPGEPLVDAQAEVDAKVAAGMSSIDERVKQIESELTVVGSKVKKMAGGDIDERDPWATAVVGAVALGVVCVLALIAVLAFLHLDRKYKTTKKVAYEARELAAKAGVQ